MDTTYFPLYRALQRPGWPAVSIQRWAITKKPSILEQKLTLMTYINFGILHKLVKTPCIYRFHKLRYGHPTFPTLYSCKGQAVNIQIWAINKKNVHPRAKVNINDLYKHGYSA